MTDIGIIGYGFVGQAIEYGFKTHEDVGHNIWVYDKYKPGQGSHPSSLERLLDESSVIFVCLPTPFNEEKLEIDLTIYDEMMAEMCPRITGKGKIVVI
jgi:phosphoglycerate dehydrogenase-like enzyme